MGAKADVKYSVFLPAGEETRKPFLPWYFEALFFIEKQARIILHNVVGMTRILQELRDEGTESTLEILAGLAPLQCKAVPAR